MCNYLQKKSCYRSSFCLRFSSSVLRSLCLSNIRAICLLKSSFGSRAADGVALVLLLLVVGLGLELAVDDTLLTESSLSREKYMLGAIYIYRYIYIYILRI